VVLYQSWWRLFVNESCLNQHKNNIHTKHISTKISMLQSVNIPYDEDWLIDYLRFYIPLKNFSLIWRRHHCRWRAAKFMPILGTQGLWAGRDLYRATPAVTRLSKCATKRWVHEIKLWSQIHYTCTCNFSIIAFIDTLWNIRLLSLFNSFITLKRSVYSQRHLLHICDIPIFAQIFLFQMNYSGKLVVAWFHSFIGISLRCFIWIYIR
jgi:hypothetical protein